jgi:hypothetical protein
MMRFASNMLVQIILGKFIGYIKPFSAMRVNAAVLFTVHEQVMA